MALTQENVSTTQLLKDAVDDAKELVRIEVALAKDEVKTELAKVIASAWLFLAALITGAFAIAFLSAALVVATSWIVGVALGVVFAIATWVVVTMAIKRIPDSALSKTRERIEADVNQLKERVA